MGPFPTSITGPSTSRPSWRIWLDRAFIQTVQTVILRPDGEMFVWGAASHLWMVLCLLRGCCPLPVCINRFYLFCLIESFWEIFERIIWNDGFLTVEDKLILSPENKRNLKRFQVYRKSLLLPPCDNRLITSLFWGSEAIFVRIIG